MTFGEAAMIMMSGSSSKPNIQQLDVTKNGKYSAINYSYDGFNPVNVNVPDRYDEGYKDGSDFYKKLYEKEKGIGETVTDIAGNPIENAIVTNSLDEVNAYLRATEFTPDDPVTITNLGADTSIRMQYETYPYTAHGDTGFRIYVFIRNLKTGKEHKYIVPNIIYASAGTTGTIKIEQLQFAYKYTTASVTFRFYVDGESGTAYQITARVADVEGTAFGTSNTAYAYS